MNRQWCFGLVVFVSIILAACSGQTKVTRDGAPLARQITESDQCGAGSQGLTYIQSREGLAKIQHWPGQALSMKPFQSLDFEREHLLVVGLGQKSTGGYALTLADSRVENKVLTLMVYLRRPPADAIVTQVITTPCAVLAISATGWKRLEVHGNGFEPMVLPAK